MFKVRKWLLDRVQYGQSFFEFSKFICDGYQSLNICLCGFLGQENHALLKAIEFF